MKYISSRDNYRAVSAVEAVKLGMVPEGGLFVPENIPQLSLQKIIEKKDASYRQLAVWILSKYLDDYSEYEIKKAVNAAYNQENFPDEFVTPLKKLEKKTYMLELWHGPTAAFKDLALQLLPHLMVRAVKKTEGKREMVILTATSGDTGKAALEGFKDVDGVRIIVFYPKEGVSEIQKKQMLSTGGSNTSVVALKGNFDDCQNAVKDVFADKKLNEFFNKKGFQFSSANSINWGRLVPQIVYYFSGYLELLNRNIIEDGEKINITVPTGNFGNILAGYYAYRMGLPVNQFICASNDNKVLTDFLTTGIYDINREFKKTISPSMDILISSNLERFLFEVTNHDGDRVNKWYKRLSSEEKFSIDDNTLQKINKIFTGKFATEYRVKNIIKKIYENHDYLLDPHTAVGISCLEEYREDKTDDTVTIVDSTANPYKFSKAVLKALKNRIELDNEYKIIESLRKLTKKRIHRNLKNLQDKDIKHNLSCGLDEVKETIKDILL
ncbi:MAG: threonine synthase [Halanaerobiales bacterium]